MIHFDESFYIALSFTIFVVACYRPVKRSIIKALDSRIDAVKTEIEAAQKLRDEAKDILRQVELEVKNMDEIAAKMAKEAKDATNTLVEIRSKELELKLKRIQNSAEQSLDNLKTRKQKELIDQFTKDAINIAQQYLISNKQNISDIEVIKHLLKESK